METESNNWSNCIPSANMELPSSTSADTKVIRAEQTYWATVYVLVMWKLKMIPINTITSDARRICLQNINHISKRSIAHEYEHNRYQERCECDGNTTYRIYIYVQRCMKQKPNFMQLA